MYREYKRLTLDEVEKHCMTDSTHYWMTLNVNGEYLREEQKSMLNYILTV